MVSNKWIQEFKENTVLTLTRTEAVGLWQLLKDVLAYLNPLWNEQVLSAAYAEGAGVANDENEALMQLYNTTQEMFHTIEVFAEACGWVKNGMPVIFGTLTVNLDSATS